MKGESLIIPESMRPDILHKLHQGHQGVNKCLARARESVWWPGITSAVKQMVERCGLCARETQSPVEPLLTTDLPSRPWQKVAAELFQLQNGQYLVIIDYFARYIEVCSLQGNTSAKQTITSFKLHLLGLDSQRCLSQTTAHNSPVTNLHSLPESTTSNT